MKPKIQNPFISNRFFVPSRIALVVAALGTASLLPAISVRAQDDGAVSAEVDSGGSSYRLFYDKLGDDGDWYQTQQYGYVYQPRVATTNRAWRPYTDGYWAQTDAGWTWVSNENFGWACYHYGHWANLVDTGWVWVPGGEWSPGNVSWRVSRDHKHIGWAPLPPEARVERSQALEGWVDTAYDIGPESYVFIDTDNFNDDSYVTHVVPVDRNVTIITETENVTRVSYRNVSSHEIIYDGGPDVEIFRDRGGRPVRRFDLDLQPQNAEFFARQDRRGISAVNGNRLMFATAAREVITSNTFRASQPPRVARSLNTVTVDRGYRGLGDQSAIERVRTTLRSQSPPPPPQVEQHATAALRKNGTVVAPISKEASHQPPAPVPATMAPAAPGSLPPGGQDHPGHRPGNVPPVSEGKPAVSPATKPVAEPATLPPGKHNIKDHGPVKPEAETPSEAAPRENTEAGAPSTKPHVNRPEHPEATKPNAKGEDAPSADHSRKADANSQQEPTPRPKAEDHPGKAGTERPDSPTGATRHQPEPPREVAPKTEEHPRANAPEGAPRRQPAAEQPKSEERARPNQAEPAARREPAAEKEHAEKAPSAPKPAAAPERAHPAEGRAEERKPAGEKPEHAPKEKGQEDDKKSPQKP